MDDHTVQSHVDSFQKEVKAYKKRADAAFKKYGRSSPDYLRCVAGRSLPQPA